MPMPMPLPTHSPSLAPVRGILDGATSRPDAVPAGYMPVLGAARPLICEFLAPMMQRPASRPAGRLNLELQAMDGRPLGRVIGQPASGGAEPVGLRLHPGRAPDWPNVRNAGGRVQSRPPTSAFPPSQTNYCCLWWLFLVIAVAIITYCVAFHLVAVASLPFLSSSLSSWTTPLSIRKVPLPPSPLPCPPSPSCQGAARQPALFLPLGCGQSFFFSLFFPILPAPLTLLLLLSSEERLPTRTPGGKFPPSLLLPPITYTSYFLPLIVILFFFSFLPFYFILFHLISLRFFVLDAAPVILATTLLIWHPTLTLL